MLEKKIIKSINAFKFLICLLHHFFFVPVAKPKDSVIGVAPQHIELVSTPVQSFSCASLSSCLESIDGVYHLTFIVDSM